VDKARAWFNGWVVTEKGGPGSGNWAHRGRPGLRGGSMAGMGGAAYALAQYTQAKRGSFETPVGNQIRDAIRNGRPDLDENQVEDLMGIISLDREYFDRYADRFGYPAGLGDTFIKEVKDNDRRALRLQHEIKQRATYKWTDDEVKDWEALNDRLSKPVGTNSRDVIGKLEDRGIRVDVNADVTEGRLHSQLSQLENSLKEYPVLGNILRDRGGRVEFREPRPGGTAEATWNEDRVTIYNKTDSYVTPSTWVHEILHGADAYTDARERDKVFGRGKQPTSYGWMNFNESWAETAMMVVMGQSGPMKWVEPGKVKMVQDVLDRMGP
jgi:hypothetical protein